MIFNLQKISKMHKKLFSGTIEIMLVAELKNHLGYDEYDHNNNSSARNGKNKSKYVVNMEK